MTSLAAHQWGLSWFENSGVGKGGPLHLVERPIMGAPGDALAGGFAVSELHALAVCDLDGDGTARLRHGKRFKSHSYNEPGSGCRLIFGLRNTGDPEQLFEASGPSTPTPGWGPRSAPRISTATATRTS